MFTLKGKIEGAEIRTTIGVSRKICCYYINRMHIFILNVLLSKGYK